MDEEQEEAAYIRGKRAAWHEIATLAARNLNDPSQFLLAERREAVTALRRLCTEIGADDMFPDDLHMVDIIEKYLARGLDNLERQP